jgi:malonyl-CoA O-methyltransferase
MGLIDAYEQFRQAQGLPATYQVVYAVLEKPQ